MPAFDPEPAVDSPPGAVPARRGRPGSPVRLDVSGQPVTKARVRRTRAWMLLLLLTPACLILVVALAIGTRGPREPAVRPAAVPAGYRPITDAYFAYAVPHGYAQNTTWTDQNGDFLYGTSRGFVAETMAVRSRPPTAASRPPASFQSFGLPAPTAYRTGTWRPIRVPGAQAAYETSIVRAHGWRATAVDVWMKRSSTQVWLLVHGPDGLAARVLTSLRG